MRLCLITNRFPTHPDDTASPFVGDFFRGLRARGVEVFVFTPEYPAFGREVPDRRVCRFTWLGSNIPIGSLDYRKPVNLLRLASFVLSGRSQLLEFLQVKEINHCLALWALPSGYFAWYARQQLGIPYSVWCLGSDIYVWAQKPLLHGLTVSVLSEATQLYADGFDLAHRVTGLAGKACSFLPSARRLPRPAQPFGAKLGSATEFLYVGRLDPDKGLAELLLAFEMVSRKYHCRLTLVGWGSLEEEVRRWIAQRSLGGRISLLGRQGAEELAGWYARADCVVIPSRSDSIPLVLAEAAQFKKPVIATRVGDLGRLVRRYRLGWVVPPANVETLALALEEFVHKGTAVRPDFKGLLQLLNIDQAVNQVIKDFGIAAAGQPHLLRTVYREKKMHLYAH